MVSQLAFLATAGFIGWLLRREHRQQPNVTGALWLPTIWMLLLCSRPVSGWLALFGFQVGGDSLEDGSPVDALAYFALILAGLVVLIRRRVQFREITRSNPLLVLFLVYCFAAIWWSDFPFIAFKRWIKILGHPIMALVLLTEPDFEAAFVQLLKRCTYILVPLSILFIKYFPVWGRAFEFWNGAPSDVGVTTNKNDLGHDCLIVGLLYFWYFLQVCQWESGRKKRNELCLCALFLGMILWLLKSAHSSTSLGSLVAGIGTILVLGRRFVDKRRVSLYAVGGIAALLLANYAFDLLDPLLAILGRDPTLTDRTKVWGVVLKVPINPILGAGFESFWLGPRLEKLWATYWWHPVQAHNGYIDTYLNLGLVGVALMLSLIISAWRKGTRILFERFEFARLRLGIVVAFTLYNVTEAAFKALHPVWFLFYLAAMDYGVPQTETAVENIPENTPIGEKDILTEGTI
jgi:O-antigen ligase